MKGLTTVLALRSVRNLLLIFILPRNEFRAESYVFLRMNEMLCPEKEVAHLFVMSKLVSVMGPENGTHSALRNPTTTSGWAGARSSLNLLYFS